MGPGSLVMFSMMTDPILAQGNQHKGTVLKLMLAKPNDCALW